MRLLITVCGRAGSKGVLSKNVATFLGVPLVYYTLASIELLRERRLDLDAVLAINTDSDELVRLINDSGVENLRVKRPAELAGERASKVDVIAQTFAVARESLGDSFNYILDLDITSPLRTVSDLETILAKRTESHADTVFSVTGSRRNPYFNMVRRDDDGFYVRAMHSDFTTRQEAPEFFDMNASMYAYTPEFLASGKQIFEGTCDIVTMRDTAVLDVDGPEDFDLMQVIAHHLFETSSQYGEIAERAEAIFSRLREDHSQLH